MKIKKYKITSISIDILSVPGIKFSSHCYYKVYKTDEIYDDYLQQRVQVVTERMHIS